MPQNNVVSIAVEFPFNGRHYKGVSLKNGVSLGSQPAACGISKTQLTFNNGVEQPIAFLENVSGGSFDSPSSPDGYLVIHPVI